MKISDDQGKDAAAARFWNSGCGFLTHEKICVGRAVNREIARRYRRWSRRSRSPRRP